MSHNQLIHRVYIIVYYFGNYIKWCIKIFSYPCSSILFATPVAKVIFLLEKIYHINIIQIDYDICFCLSIDSVIIIKAVIFRDYNII